MAVNVDEIVCPARSNSVNVRVIHVGDFNPQTRHSLGMGYAGMKKKIIS